MLKFNENKCDFEIYYFNKTKLMTDISYEWTTCIGIKAYIMIVYFQQDKKGMICWKMKVICILNKKIDILSYSHSKFDYL